MTADPVFYRVGDADPGVLAGVTVAVVGYGNLGSSVAKILRQAGMEVLVGNRQDPWRQRAVEDGFEVVEIPQAVARAELSYVLLPDDVIPHIFIAEIAPTLAPGSAVCFASGFCLAFGALEIPAGIDVLMLAPRMLGTELAAVVAAGGSFVSYVSVEQDATGKARARLLALALALGALRRGALSLSASQEATIDLLVEQTVGPYLGTAIQLAFALGVEAGLPPEAMVLELYASGEMSQVFRTFATEGFYPSVNAHGAAATYGGFLRTLELDSASMRNHFRSVLEDIRDGGFAAKLAAEQAKGYPTLAAIDSMTSADDDMTSAEIRVKAAIGSP